MYTKRDQRRQFLKLASGLLAAPLGTMASFANAQSSGQAPIRFITIVDHYGVPTTDRQNTWIRSDSGDYDLEDDDLGRVLQPLSAYRENMIVMSGIDSNSLSDTGGQRSHAQFDAHLLGASTTSGTNNGREADARLTHPSLDVRIGNSIHENASRPFPHLFFTDYAARGDPTYSFDNSGTMIRSLVDPTEAVENLLNNASGGQVDPAIQAEVMARQDLLDKVGERVRMLRSDLNNASAVERLDAYDQSVGELATQLELAQTQTCSVPDEFDDLGDGGRNTPGDERGEMLQVIGQLFACDMVSSVLYAFGGEAIDNHRYPFLDGDDNDVQDLLGTNLHAASHRDDAAARRVHELVRTFQSEQTALLLDRLSNTTDVDGNPMIDNTVMYLPTCMSHNTHQRDDYALAMIAGRNTNLITGRHYDLGNDTNNDLLVTVAQGCNVPITDHGGYRANGNRENSLNNGPIGKMLKNTLG